MRFERPRNLRKTAAIRSLVAETVLLPEQLMMPFFVVAGRQQVQPIAALPGISRFSVDTLLPRLEQALKLGMRSVLLFGVVSEDLKSPEGSAAAAADGPVAQAIRAARDAFGDDLVIASDICLCAYTNHGHCGHLRNTTRGVVIDNDSSLIGLAAMALTHAEAGVDFVAPSDMMDGRVAFLREALDGAGHSDVAILSYAVKYASAFYGPFRDAAGSAPVSVRLEASRIPSDRKTYQMDPRNAREALREAALDERQGADMLMVKPAGPYLDIISKIRSQTVLPIVAYQVSGEYAMLRAAAAAGMLDEPAAVAETLLGIRRAGADIIISYYAVEALEQGWLR